MSKLYICGTPIGNLDDVTIRLLKTLRQVDLIACEDTRQTRKLLNRYKIKKQLVSYHQHSGVARENFIIGELQAGKNVALVSDAGMPLISDPGENLVKRALQKEIDIEVIPGPSALVTALVVSGLDADAFVFSGFLPSRASRRTEALKEMEQEKRTSIFYEAPHRLLDTLHDIQDMMGDDREIVIARELTKLHEEVVRGSAAGVREHYEKHLPRGEICVLVAGRQPEEKEVDLEQLCREIDQLLKDGCSKKEAFKVKACQYRINKSSLYNYYHQRDNPKRE